MENSSDVALLELTQILPVLEGLKHDIGTYLNKNDPKVSRFLKSIARVRTLFSQIFGSSETFDSFIGEFYVDPKKEDIWLEAREYLDSVITLIESTKKNFKTDEKLKQIIGEISDLRQKNKLHETTNTNLELGIARLAKENDNLEKQLRSIAKQRSDLEEKAKNLSNVNSSLTRLVDELQKREDTYLTAIKTTDSRNGIDLESKNMLLASYRRQKSILLRNLTTYQETKAKYGLNAPTDILHGISETEKELERIERNITNLEHQ